MINYPKDRQEFRSWYEDNSTTEQEVWVKYTHDGNMIGQWNDKDRLLDY